MEERAFNIFIFFENGLAESYGVYHHNLYGDDDAKADALKKSVEADYRRAKRFALPRPLNPHEWKSLQRVSSHLQCLEEGFQFFRAKSNPLFCITCIVDGVPEIEREVFGELRGDNATDVGDGQVMKDYLVEYCKNGVFDLGQLIHDDYFVAIKLLLNAGQHVSCCKLLMSCVDTISYIEFGDKKNNFVEWLTRYTVLQKVGLSAEEIWEFRNSILHMTNLQSRKVRKGEISSIAPYVAPKGYELPTEHGDKLSLKYFNLHLLIELIAQGIARWGADLQGKGAIEKFVERYDSVISDARPMTQSI